MGVLLIILEIVYFCFPHVGGVPVIVRFAHCIQSPELFFPQPFICTRKAGPRAGLQPHVGLVPIPKSREWRHPCSFIHHFFSCEPYSLDIEKSGFNFFFQVNRIACTHGQKVFAVLNQDLKLAIPTLLLFLFNQIWNIFWQVVFLTGFGYVYVDIAHQCGTVCITIAPEGKTGPMLTSANRQVCLPERAQ